MSKRITRRLNLLRVRSASDTVEVKALISPLRYDVVVRADFLNALRQGLVDASLDRVMAYALTAPYFQWFKHVECARFFPEVLRDEGLLLERYKSRVSRAIATLRSFERSGFDPRHPVTLFRTTNGVRTDLGIHVSNGMHIKDGCHRVALLLLNGESLRPTMYRLTPGVARAPDNTARLLRHIRVEPGKYAEFLASGFHVPAHDNLQEVRREVAASQPGRLAEFDEVVQAHAKAQLDFVG